jgi:hypothetical protein
LQKLPTHPFSPNVIVENDEVRLYSAHFTQVRVQKQLEKYLAIICRKDFLEQREDVI